MSHTEDEAVTVRVLRTAARTADLDVVVSLNLTGLGLRRLEGVGQCPNLQRLVVAHNQLESLDGVERLCKLRVLDASSNRLTRVDAVEALGALVELHLEDNGLRHLRDLTCLMHLPRLCALYLRDIDGRRANPVCGAGLEYREEVFSLLPHVDNVDGWRRSWNTSPHFAAVFGPLPTIDQPHIPLPPSQRWIKEADVGEKRSKEIFTNESDTYFQSLVGQCQQLLE